MATLNAFEAALNDVIAAKRLSQSKMDTLTESALKCIENDTKMVLTLHRTHQGLSPSGKGRSLYAFDALARAARHQVNKNNLVADMNSERGNCATFLRRLESILDGFFQDLVSSGNEDLK
ncbi:hypothetical protein C8Q80DRAFT_247169 [Daedaleopsis nitida]|nr:hypothetical protein C8Q80DRAFT_247169 [Daedaleopsis nitida]